VFRKLVRWILKFAIGLFVVIVLAATGSFIYVYLNKDVIINRFSATLNRLVNGEIKMKEIKIDFFHYFPSTAIHIKEFAVRDSLFHVHQMEFLHADDVYVKINFRDLFSSRLAVENISFHHGSLYAFKDSSGYTNNYIFRNKVSKPGSAFKTFLDEVELKDFKVIYKDQKKTSFFNVYINQLKCGIQEYQGKLALAVRSDGIIKMLAFKLNKGAYARNATFNNHFIAYYDQRDNSLDVPPHTFYLNDQLVEANALLHFAPLSKFSVDLSSPRIHMDEALKLATYKTQQTISKYQFERPLRIRVHLEGSLEPGKIPLLNVEMITAGNTLNYKNHQVTKCRMRASYSNKTDSSQAAAISNTSVFITAASGEWEGIPVTADTILIDNFPFPTVTTLLHSTFPLANLNRLSNEKLYFFTEGQCTYEIAYQGFGDSIQWHDDVHARVQITNGSLVYEPRGMPFYDVNAVILVNNDDIKIDTMECRSGNSLLSLKGEAPGIFSPQQVNQQGALLKWEIKSTKLNLHDFTSFLGSRKRMFTKVKKSSADKNNFEKNLDNYLNACRLKMKVNISEISFEQFTASSLTGTVSMTDSSWLLDKISFEHAGGKVLLDGKLIGKGENLNNVFIKSTLKHVNISQVFAAFGDFSQQTLTNKQIDGNLDADISFQCEMNHRAVINQSSIEGDVKLTITDGELKGFQPMGKLSKFIFRNRDFSNIQFSDLTNSFLVKGNDIYFDRMKINSSVLELYLQGSYRLDGKTDMHIQVPLSNLKKRDWEELSDNITDKGDKGVNVFIHAYTDDTGELRFKYDPLKKIKDRR